MGLMVILLVAIFDFLIGAVVGPQSDLVRAQGFVGWNCEYRLIQKWDFRKKRLTYYSYLRSVCQF